MKTLIYVPVAIIFAFLFAALLFFSADAIVGEDSIPYPGKITDKIYRAAYTTTHRVHRKNGGSYLKSTYHPATYHVSVQAPDTVFEWAVFRDTFYRVSAGQDVTCTKRIGKWTRLSYGWRVASFTKTIMLPEGN